MKKQKGIAEIAVAMGIVVMWVASALTAVVTDTTAKAKKAEAETAKVAEAKPQ